MTVKNLTKKVTRTGTGATFTFSFSPMVIYASTDLEVTLVTIATGAETLLVEGTGSANYSVSVSEYPGTGSVIYPADLSTEITSAYSVVIKRKIPIDQQVGLSNQGGYYPDVQEKIVDKLAIIALQQQEEIDRSMKFVVSADLSSFDEEIPDPSLFSAGQVLALTATGLTWLTPNSAAYLTLPLTSTDNAVPRFDGTGGDAFQDSGVIVDDSDNVSGVANLTITGNVIGVVNLNGVAIGDYLIGTDIGVSVQGYNANTLFADETDQLTVGFTGTPYATGNTGSGTVTLVAANGNIQYGTVNGSFTLGAPTIPGAGYIEWEITNDGTGGYSPDFSSNVDKLEGTYDDAASATNVVRLTKLNGHTICEIFNVDL